MSAWTAVEGAIIAARREAKLPSKCVPKLELRNEGPWMPDLVRDSYYFPVRSPTNPLERAFLRAVQLAR